MEEFKKKKPKIQTVIYLRISEDQKIFIEKNDIHISKLVRHLLDEYIKSQTKT